MPIAGFGMNRYRPRLDQTRLPVYRYMRYDYARCPTVEYITIIYNTVFYYYYYCLYERIYRRCVRTRYSARNVYTRYRVCICLYREFVQTVFYPRFLHRSSLAPPYRTHARCVLEIFTGDRST